MGDFFYGELNDTESTLLGYIDDESDKELQGKLIDSNKEINADLENIYNNDPENSPYIYGKLLKEVQVEKLTYEGRASENAATYVDNIDQTIKVVVDTDVIATKDFVNNSVSKKGAYLDVSLDNTTYILTAKLYDSDGNILGEPQIIDLPIESLVVNGRYDNDSQSIIFILQNGNEIKVPLSDLITNFQSTFETLKLEKDLYIYAPSGNITDASPLNGVKIGSAGDTFESAWNKMFGQQDSQPKITSYPSLKLTFNSYGGDTQEYGSKVAKLPFNLTKEDGSYTYEAVTGVTWLDNPIFKVGETILVNENNKLDVDYIVGVSSALTITALQNYSGGNIAKTLLGKDSNPVIQISSGTATTSTNFKINSVKYAYYGLTSSTDLPIVDGKCILNKRTTSGTSGEYSFAPNKQYLWLATPTQISKITWNGNLLTQGSSEDYTYVGPYTITLDTDANVTYYFYMMNGSKTGTFTYIIT